jgi:hypothetical protein
LKISGHEYPKGTDKCKFCGILKSGKNLEEIYNKFSHVILNGSVLKIFEYSKEYESTNKNTVNQILKVKADNFIEEFSEIEDYKLIHEINNRLNALEEHEELKILQTVYDYTKIPLEALIEEQQKDKLFIKKAILFIHHRKIGDILMNIFSALFKIQILNTLN